MRCGVAAMQALRAAGVTKIFGLMGSSTLEMYDALYDMKDIEYIGVRHENCGMHMADAYGRVTQAPGLFICGQAGPGSSNMVLGLAAAKMAYSPVVVITGLPSTEHLGRDAFQEIDQHTLFLPVTKRVMTVPRPERIPEFFLEAFRIANSGRRGPVVVNIPRDLFNCDVDVTIPLPGSRPELEGGAVERATLEKIKSMLLAARMPVIHAGAGIKWGRASEKLITLAEKLQLPITASAGHGDVVANDHPLYAGQVGPRGNAVASGLMREADVILALGTRLGFNTTRYQYEHISPAAKIIQVDIDPIAVGRYFPVALGIVGDAGTIAAGLCEMIGAISADKAPWKARNDRFRKDREELWRQREEAAGLTGKPLHPEVIYAELRKVAPRDVLFTIDAGTTGLQATDKLPYRTVPAMLTPLDCGNIGFSYAAGLGAKVAARQRTVISLMGDGGFGMTMGEMNTAVMHDIATIAIVMDNGTWGSEIAYQRDFYNRRYIGAHVHSPRFDEVMKLCGGNGYFVTEPGGTADAVRQAMKEGKPAVIHVKVDPEAVISFRTDALKKRG
ncbi:MAG: thiamine pyrophosphate-binding protein, partial [Betaproteobacteria bacterium]|nr:thiamine pyrophosphate-binding protein [Betaproteobacteria bacterium]